MKKTIHKWLSRLMMTLIALAVGVPLSQAAVTVNVKTTSGKTPHMYAWYNYNGTQKPLGDFPGRALSPVSDFKGGTYYSITIETGGGDLSFILSDGNGNQTIDIIGLNDNGYCYTYSWDGGSGWTLDKCERIAGVTSISTGFSFDRAQNSKVIYFVGEPWEVNAEKRVWAYTWSGSGNDAVKYSGDWPGTEMSLVSQQENQYCYKLEVPSGSPVNVIFNNGDNGEQTGDLPFDDGGVYDRANLLMVATGVDIDYTDATAIPEIELRRALKQHDPNNDGKITDFERLHATQAGFNYRWDSGSEHLDEVQYLAGITNLNWLKNFPNATSLEVVYFNGGNHDWYREIGHFAFEEDKAYEGHNFKQGNLGAVSLEEFPLLTDVAIVGAKVSSIDLSKNPNIETLDLCGNSLQTIDVSNLSNLTSLEVDFNQLTGVDVSQNSNLETLSISGNPINSSLTVTNTNLQRLCANKCGLTGLTLTTPALTKLVARYNSLTGLNVSGLTNLEGMYVNNNNLSAINLASNSKLTELNVSHNELTSLDLTGTKVDDIRCAANQLTSLTLVSTVTDIDCSNNLLSSLDLSMVPRLDKTVCFSKNNFTTLDFTNTEIVEELKVAGNHLTALNLGSNNWEGFSDLTIANNDFTSLDLTSLIPYIDNLIACGNQFTDGSLVLPTVTYTSSGGKDDKDAPRRNVKRNAEPSVIHKAFDPDDYEGMKYLQIDDNAFTTFDFSGMPYLKGLSCGGNQMTAIDLSNQHNKMKDATDEEYLSHDIATLIAIDWDGDYYDYLDMYCDQYGLTQAELIQRETDGFICDYGVNAPWPESGDLGIGNTRALVAEWAQNAGNDIYFIRLDDNAAGTLGTITAADHLGSEFDLTKVTAWTNATVTNDATYGNILLLDANNQSVDYAYSTGHTVERSSDSYKSTTFNFTWTAPAAPTVVGGATELALTPGDGTVYGGYTEVTIDIPDGTTVTVTIDGEPVEVQNNGTDNYITLPHDNDSAIEGHTVVVTPSTGDPVTATYTFMPTPGEQTHWVNVAAESEIDTSKPVFFAEFEDMTNLTLRGMSIIPIGQDTHVATNETVTATVNTTIQDAHDHYDVTLPYNSTADMYSITPVDGVEHGYNIKSFVSGKYLAFNGTANLVDSDEPCTLYLLGDDTGVYGFADFIPADEQDMNIMRAIYYDVDLGKFMAYNEPEALAREHDGHPFRMVYLFNQTDTKPDAPIFSKAEGSVLRFGTRVKITNNPRNDINGHFTSDNTDPTVLGGEYRLRYKDFIEIEHRRQGWKGDEPYMTGTFPTLEGTLTLRAVHSVGYLYSDESIVHYTCPPQLPYTFVQVTSQDQLVAGKRYLVVAALHDKEGDYNSAMGACSDDDDATFYSDDIDIPNGFIDLEPWYYPEPYILGGSDGAWTFTDNTFGKYVGATTYTPSGGSARYVPALYENVNDAAPFTITFDNDNFVELDFGTAGKLSINGKGNFKYGNPSDNDDLLGMMLFVEHESELAELDAVGGEFSVSADKKIEFSKGNIQYHTGTRQWRAAEHQYDVIGVADNIRLGDPSLSAWVDLFAWSCESVPYGVSPSNKDADYTGDFIDWSTNFEGEWFTPSKDEWQYLLTGRANAANLRGEGNVAGMNGIILLPDNWVMPDGMTFLAGYVGWEDANVEDDYLENVYTAAEWEVMEAAGAVFLPNAGSRTGGYGNTWNGAAEATFTNPETSFYSWVENVDEVGYYWSSTLNPNNSNSVYYMIVPGMTLDSNGNVTSYTAPVMWTRERRRGNSVRLVREAVQTVEVPMPTFNPPPGSYRGDYLDIAIELAEGHENDRVFFTVAKHDMPADPTTSDREYTGQRFRINDGSTVIVKAIAMDADGNFSPVNTGHYYIHEDMPFDFRRANSTADLVPGREFIFVYEDDDVEGADYYDYGAMASTPTSGLRNHVGATDPSPADLVDAIVNSNLLVVEKYMGTVCMTRNDVSIFQLGKDGYDYTFYDFNNNKFLASVENSAGLVDGVTADSKFRIQIDPTTHAINMSADGEIGLMYDDVNQKYGFFSQDSHKRVALYYRENNHMTLAEFKNLDTDVEKDYNGDVARTVTINEPLTVAYVIDAKEPIDALISGYLVLCDNSESTDRVVTPIAGQEELLIKGAGSYFPKNEIPQELYTQKNWLLVATLNTGLFTGNYTVPSSQYSVGDVIKANTVSGMAYHLLPMVLAYNSSLQPEVDTEAAQQTVVYNTYTPAHFNDDNLNLGQDGQPFKYFMMSPKRMEVANITYAVYKNSPAPGMYTKAGEEAEGSFNILFDGNLATGKYGEGEGQNFTSSTNFDDVFTSEEEGNAYEFRGIVWPNEGWDEDGDDGYDDEFVVVYDIDSDNPVFGHAPRNPFKVRRLVEKATPSSVSPNGDFNVLILDIDARNEESTSVITGIEDIVNADATSIKAVRYYNVAGMESDKPFDGVNIIVTEFNDGTTTTNKVLK